MGLVAMCLVPLVTLPSWSDFIGTEVIFAALFGALVWLQMSQRVWYDEREVCSCILGKGRECIPFAEIAAISASHSWERAAARRPISELEITSRSGRTICISLRHLSVPGLQEMVDEIHRRTGLSVPELRKSVK
jgi:hypothetical protein